MAFTSRKIGVTASKLVLEKKGWGPRVSKLSQINLMFPDVRMVIGVSIDIFLVFLGVFL